jgi:hypothetical protein
MQKIKLILKHYTRNFTIKCSRKSESSQRNQILFTVVPFIHSFAAGETAQAVMHLPSKREALSSNPSTTKKSSAFHSFSYLQQTTDLKYQYSKISETNNS